MKRIVSVLFVLLIAACGNSVSKITEVEAESIVLQHLTEDRNNKESEIKIKSVSKGWGKYIVEWEIDEGCEFGTVQIDDQSGDFLKAVETNC